MPRAKAKQGLRAYALRLPEDLYEAITQLAEAEVRPINSQMIVLLRKAVELEQAQVAKTKRAPKPPRA